jgi:hypothetical protein
MPVLVQFVAKVPDVDRVVAAAKKFEADNVRLGARNPQVFEDENEPGTVAMMSEWDSHDVAHAAMEELGPGFTEAAGDHEWVTHMWRLK